MRVKLFAPSASGHAIIMLLLMLRPTPIWLAILSCGALAPVARAADPSCPSQTPAVLPSPQPPAATAKPKEKGLAAGDLISIEADHTDYDVNSDSAIFTGHVVIRQGDRQIKADQVEIDTKKNVKGQGGIDYTDPLVHILGAGGDYSPSGGADFRDAQFQMLQRSARGSAQTMSLTPEGILNLKDVRYTTCPPNDNSRSLDAHDIKLDTRAKEGAARGAKIDFKGVPILYL